MSDRFLHDEFIGRWLGGSLSPAELTELESWMAAHSEQGVYLLSLQRVWERTGSLRVRDSDVDLAWTNLRPKLRATARTRKLSLPWVWAAAALVLIAVGVHQWLDREIVVTIATDRGETHQLLLPDRSEVTLNAESEIEFDGNHFRDDRRVRLQGEAFFNVVKQKAPFTVVSGDVQTTVLGTSFNIRSRGDDVEVACMTGRVQVRSEETMVELSPGFATRRVGRALSEPYTVDASRRAAWMFDRLHFESVPLETVWEEIERRCNVIVQRPQLDLTFSGVVHVGSAERAIDQVCRTAGLSYGKKGDTLYVVRRKNKGE